MVLLLLVGVDLVLFLADVDWFEGVDTLFSPASYVTTDPLLLLLNNDDLYFSSLKLFYEFLPTDCRLLVYKYFGDFSNVDGKIRSLSVVLLVWL